MVDGLQIPTTNSGQVSLRARWSSQLPRVSNWSVRYQGVARDPRALIESPIRGIGVMNSLTEEARREIRFISSHMVGQESQDTVIRFEVGETAAREIQAVIGRRGGRSGSGPHQPASNTIGRTSPPTPTSFSTSNTEGPWEETGSQDRRQPAVLAASLHPGPSPPPPSYPHLNLT